MDKRRIIQVIWTVITNSFVSGFKTGKIYSGKLKAICVPGLNCYSCPGALGSCPIGALQAVLGKRGNFFSFYIVGFLLAIGAVFGRFVCGFLCPFGLIQELLNKIPFIKKIRTFPGDRFLRKLKYLILFVFVILLPLFLTDIIGQGSPYFCKLICPAGTLSAGIPLVISNPILRETIGFLYTWKLTILILTIILSVIIYRPFCKYICPLGAIYSFFNPIAIFKYRHNPGLCTNCGSCKKSCPMAIDPVKECNHPECIRCGNCKKVCEVNAIK